MAPSTKINLKNKIEDGVLDLSMSGLQEIPIKEIVSKWLCGKPVLTIFQK